MKITLARVMGSCFGVEDAVEMAMDFDKAEDLTILGQLVHNPQTVRKLQERGIRLLNGIEDVDKIETRHVMITAHGAADLIKKKVAEKNLVILDATCPLVQHVHRTIKKMVKLGYFPVVIGEEKHVEVRGIVGDLVEYLVINRADQIESIPQEKRRKLGMVSQTTQNAQFSERLVEEIRARTDVDEVKFVNTVCKPTRDRQEAVEELSEQVDVMIVVGGKNSSNTRKLKILCEKKGIKAYHIESVDELRPEWFEGMQHAGITAGTSTPSYVIGEVHEAMLMMTPTG